ncbi:MAG: TRAP transporter substrate-binding protein [Betaproteobacteria bacterium]
MTLVTRRTAIKTAFAAAASLAAPALVRAQSGLSLRMSSSLTADMNSSHFVWYDRFSKNLKASVGDKVSIVYFPNNQLGKESDIVQQVRLGAMDMMISGTSIWATAMPEIGVLDMGYLFQNWDHVGRSLDGAAGASLSKLLLERASIMPLGYAYSLGARNVYTKTQLKSAADLHGVKVRVLPVPNFVTTLKLMGAVATPIPFGEIYTALQTGVVDGVEQDAPTVLAGKFYEVAKHCMLTEHIFNPVIPVISKRAFDRIPADLQKPFLEAAREATVYQRGQAGSAEVKAFEQLKALGVTVQAVDRVALAKAVSPMWGEFATQYPATAPIVKAIQSAKT